MNMSLTMMNKTQTDCDAHCALLVLELLYQKEMESVRDISRKMCLLQLYAHTADNFNTHIDAFADRIVARADSFIKGKRG